MSAEELESKIELQAKSLKEKDEMLSTRYNVITHLSQKNTNLKQALNEIRECCENNSLEVNTREYGNLVVTNTDDILQIIDKVLGVDEIERNNN